MKKCVEHLAIDHGYQKIAFLSGPKVNADANERLSAYLDVMHSCGYPVTNTMVAYGNYTENVDDLVQLLLDQNPGLEAIVCANDNMAKSCYRVCQERDLIVGKDIAITGFDDVEIATEMTPPLTSVTQSSYALSYAAVKKAIALCEGESVSSEKLPLTLQIRSSCGCEQNLYDYNAQFPPEELEAIVRSEAEQMADRLLRHIPYAEERNQYTAFIREFFDYLYRSLIALREEYQPDYLFGILKELVQYPYLPHSKLSKYMTRLIRLILNNVDDLAMKRQLSLIIEDTKQEIFSHEKNKTEQEIKLLNRKAWFVPSLTRDLHHSGTREDLHDVLIPIMQRFQTMNVKSCYIYLFPEPVTHQANTSVLFPRSLYLTAYYNQNAMLCYPNNKRPCITERNGFASNIPDDRSVILTSFVLFSEDRQYGIMLCEVTPEDISFLYTCGMQIGSLLRYLEMNWMEQDAAVELRNSLNVIQEQNRVLSFISDYDELSQLLNRRGFMEHAIATLTQNKGRKAYIIFCDLDHLKEINDCFGHTAGDFAIQSAAKLMRTSLPENAILARIGGDEFVSIVLSDEPSYKEEITLHIKEMQDNFNNSQNLPYYIEFSVGIYEFVCDPDVELNKVIQKSDELLYQAKQNRRKTVKK